MKKIIILLFVLSLSAACKKATLLDNKSNNALNETTVFTDSVNAMSFLTRVYMDLGFTFDKDRYENGSTEQATDDSEYTLLNPVRRPLVLYTSNYSADDTRMLFETWTLPYQNIRRVNLFLSKMPDMPFKPATKTRLAAEARCMRAWYYYNMLIVFGGVPIVGDKVFASDELISVPRNTFEECVNYVVKELDEVSAILPADYTGNDYGRVTRGAALAIKTKMLLFAASPLFNGNTWPGVPEASKTPERIAVAGYPNFDVNRWQKVLDAANAITGYNLYTDPNNTTPGYGFYSGFLLRRNPEFIFFVNRPPNRDFEQFYLPASRGGNKNGAPTQNIVDAFPMNDGKAITESSAYNPQNPYANRDPRFGFSIIFNTAPYFSTSTNSKIAVFTYVGAATDGFTQSASAAGPSGYYCRKMCDENVVGNTGNTAFRPYILIRYAEILLIKAEALNELGKPQAEVMAPIVEIRQRAGIVPGAGNTYGIKANMTQAEMRSFIQNERRIELYNEDKRWDDVRRWKLALNYFNGYNKLMKITKLTSNPDTYKYEVVNSLFLHTFNERNYLLPMQISEILKNTALIQNPGW